VAGPPLTGAASEVLQRTAGRRLEEARLEALEERLEVDPTAPCRAWRSALAIFRELGMPEAEEVAAWLDRR
jgi:hypothetical protein